MPFPKTLRTVGDHLRKRRLELGLRQEDLAKRLALSVSTITHWERNDDPPAARHLPKIIEFLGYVPFEAGSSLFDRLIYHAKIAGIEPRALARMLGVREEMLGRWERGEEQPAGPIFALIEKLLSDPNLIQGKPSPGESGEAINK